MRQNATAFVIFAGALPEKETRRIRHFSQTLVVCRPNGRLRREISKENLPKWRSVRSFFANIDFRFFCRTADSPIFFDSIGFFVCLDAQIRRNLLSRRCFRLFRKHWFFPAWMLRYTGDLIKANLPNRFSVRLFCEYWFNSRLNSQLRRKITTANLPNCHCACLFPGLGFPPPQRPNPPEQ